MYPCSNDLSTAVSMGPVVQTPLPHAAVNELNMLRIYTPTIDFMSTGDNLDDSGHLVIRPTTATWKVRGLGLKKTVLDSTVFDSTVHVPRRCFPSSRTRTKARSDACSPASGASPPPGSKTRSTCCARSVSRTFEHRYLATCKFTQFLLVSSFAAACEARSRLPERQRPGGSGAVRHVVCLGAACAGETHEDPFVQGARVPEARTT